MSESAQHSALPWQISEFGIRELKAKYLCIKHGARTIARIDAHGNSLSVTEQDEANARLIVRSVNNAEKLAEALREVKSDASITGEFPSVVIRRSTFNKAIAALAQWEAAQ